MIFLNIRDRMWSQLAGPLWLDQTAPLGWLAMQRAILQLFGAGDRAVRAVSVLFGVATLICAVWVGLRWLKPGGAALFVLLCGFTQWMTFYALEAKPYAGDAFWALLLPASVVWATEGNGESSISLRRSLVWWITATVGQWISYGAIFVAPGCAVLLCVIAWRRNGWRRALLGGTPRHSLAGVFCRSLLPGDSACPSESPSSPPTGQRVCRPTKRPSSKGSYGSAGRLSHWHRIPAARVSG